MIPMVLAGRVTKDGQLIRNCSRYSCSTLYVDAKYDSSRYLSFSFRGGATPLFNNRR